MNPTQQPLQNSSPLQQPVPPAGGTPLQQGKGLNWMIIVMIIALILLFAGIVYYLIVQSVVPSRRSILPTTIPAQTVVTPTPSPATEEEQINAVDVSEPTQELQDVEKDIQGL